MTKLAAVFQSHRSGYWGVDAGASDVDVRAIRNGDVGTSGELRWDRLPLRGFSERECEHALVRAGDIVLTTSGNCGNVAFIPDNPAEPTAATNFVRILRTDSDAVDPRYAFHFLRTRTFHDALGPFIRGATIQNLSVAAAFDVVQIPTPALVEQRRIAAILDQADALRAKRRQALAHLGTLTEAMFHDMFGDPVRNDRDWPTCRLSELGALDRGVSKHRPRNDPALLGGEHPLIQTGDVANSGGYITTYTTTYSDLGLAQSKKWPAGTLCITIAANIARTGTLQFEACFPDSVVGFTSDPDTTTYVQVWLGFLQAGLEASAPQSAQKNINLALLRGLEVPVPTKGLLQTFAQRVHALKVQRTRVLATQTAEDQLFSSLQVRAFQGEL